MFTRLQRLNNECSHEEYYNQFLTDSIIGLVKKRFTKEELKAAHEQDEHLNTIKLAAWDSLGESLKSSGLSVRFKAVGDYLTQDMNFLKTLTHIYKDLLILTFVLITFVCLVFLSVIYIGSLG